MIAREVSFPKTLHMRKGFDAYLTEDNGIIKREFGQTDSGGEFNGMWVYRDQYNFVIDHSAYRNDLFEKHKITIVE